MVEFKRTMSGYDVLINGQQLGCIDQDNGFFTSPVVGPKDHLNISLKDLVDITEFISSRFALKHNKLPTRRVSVHAP